MKNVVRKTLCAALVMGLSFSLIACGGSSGDKETAKSDSKESKTEEKKIEAAQDKAAATKDKVSDVFEAKVFEEK